MARSISNDKRESATSEQERTKRRSADKAHRRDLWPLDTSKANGHTHRTGLSQKPIAAMASKASKVDIKLDPIWEDLDWAIGQMLIMGWDGTEVTPQICTLIEEHHLGSILLTAKNLKSAHQTAKLVQELQTIAHKANHPQPLLIAVDQENGGVNSLFDEDYVCQFPSAMGIAATGRAELAYEVNKATASAVGACGVNMMLGPVLDVLSNARYQPLGVRATGDDPQEVSQASTIIIVTADANRNLYQSGFTKHVEMMCAMLRSRGQKKSVMVVAVSSPYDFALDKTIGTYICTFDFTENALNALVRALCGDFVPKGSLPGTLRKSKKVLKSRQNWIVEEYDRERDADGLHELIKATARANSADLGCLETATAASFELFNPKIDETHFVVRNSSTNALYGFAATYAIDRTGILGAIFVDPSKRNHSVGRSLHRRAIRHLTKKRSIKKVQLGTCFPGIFLGIPIGEGIAASWFANNGWDIQFPKRLTNLVINDLSTWTVPEGLLQGIQRASISFDLIHGLDNGDAERVLSHVSQHATAEVLELYRCALQETKACGIVRSKKADDTLLGTIIICSPGSPLATYVPPLMPRRGEGIGGLLAPVVPPTSQDVLVLQGLVLMGTRQNKAHKSAKTVLSWVQDAAYEHVVAMGFEILQSFEEMTNTPDTWADLI
ncbi:hypothetical protein BN1723_011411 [Verticillium longisporum]|uniref:N-acetyltransferase domain-containing protein n=1 Tax=Verticillium longisporum TaxID=100787 RepID=A0A0G4L797_VERLO|nr:hypothetical protein BN1723_011411 [Verticillium longisporum]